MYVMYVIDSLSRGGAERSLTELAPEYRSRGVGLAVAYLHNRPGLQCELERAGAQLFCLNGAGGRVGWARRAWRLADRLQPDIIHTTLFESDIAGRIAGKLLHIPTVCSLVGTPYGPSHLLDPAVSRWKVWGARMLDSKTAQCVARFHAVSDHVANVMSPRLHIPRHKIDVIPRGRDPARLGCRTATRRRQARAELAVPERTPLLLAAARHDYAKGLDILLAAFARILRTNRGARLFIAGREASASSSLRRLVRDLAIAPSAVRFLGDSDSLEDMLCAADVLVLPSRREGFPGILLEAMALETPIVASDIPPVREILDEQTGRLVPPDDASALAEAILSVLDGTLGPTQERTRRAHMRFLTRFTIGRVADCMVQFYLRVLGRGSTNRDLAWTTQ